MKPYYDRKNWRPVPQQQKDALGFWLCRNCPNHVAKGRRSYCSRECAMAFEIAYFPSRTRFHVRERDHGVCSLCKTDTEMLRRVLRACRHFSLEGDRKGVGAAVWAARELGFNGALFEGELWQADHIKECVRGGWGTGLENLQTLCTPCHKIKTRQLAADLARSRRDRADERKRSNGCMDGLFEPAIGAGGAA